MTSATRGDLERSKTISSDFLSEYAYRFIIYIEGTSHLAHNLLTGASILYGSVVQTSRMLILPVSSHACTSY